MYFNIQLSDFENNKKIIVMFSQNLVNLTGQSQMGTCKRERREYNIKLLIEPKLFGVHLSFEI